MWMFIVFLVILAAPLISERLSNLICAKKCVSGSSFDLKYVNNDFNDHLVFGVCRDSTRPAKYIQIWYECSVYSTLVSMY